MASGWSKYPKDKLKEARQMYVEDNIPLKDVANEVGIPYATLKHHEKSKWKKEKDLYNARILKGLQAGELEDLIAIGLSAQKVIRRAMEHMANGRATPTMRDAQIASRVNRDLHEIAIKLKESKDKPIDINTEEALMEFDNDPFLGSGEGSEDINENS